MERSSTSGGTASLPTILDVARLAGVSKSTVSNVLRATGRVSAGTRTQVLAAIDELGYRPNVLARNLVRRRTSTLGLLVGDLANPFYSELAKLVEQRASAAGYTTMIANTDGRPDFERARVETLLEHRVAGILVLQLTGGRATVTDVLARAVPLVVLTCPEEEGADSVSVDDAEGVHAATVHLLGLGHRRIAYLTSDLIEVGSDRLRREGYLRGLREADIESSSDLIRPVSQLEAPDGAIAEAVVGLVGLCNRPTAIICANDLIAVDVLDTLEGLGLAVPADVSVVGFDDIALASLRRISLTTVSQPREELARLAVELALDRIELGFDGPPRRVHLAPTLVVRSSTGPPR
jgi:DNA-binding LacI/PurR family transcriptional regulator